MSKVIDELKAFESEPKLNLKEAIIGKCETEIRSFADRYPIDSNETLRVTKGKRLLPRYKDKHLYHEKVIEPSTTKQAEIPVRKISNEELAVSSVQKIVGSDISLMDNYLITVDGHNKVKLAIHSNRLVEMVKKEGKKEDVTTPTAPPLNKVDEFREKILNVKTTPTETVHTTHDVIKILQILDKKKKVKVSKYEKIKKPTIIEYLAHTTDGGPSRVHYFTYGRQIDEFIDVTKERNPFQLVEYTLGRGREMLSLKCEKRKTPGYLSDTYTSSLQGSKLSRLYTPYIEEKALGKLDITPDFWQIVEGRSIIDKLDKKELKHFLEDNLRKTITASCLGEEEARCQVKHRIDCSLLPPLEDELYHMETFKAFIHEKYCECLHTVAYAEEITHIRTQIISIHKELEDKLELITGDLIDIYDLRGRIKWCRDITHKLSPKIWKYEFSVESEKFKSPFLHKLDKLMKFYRTPNHTGLKYVDKLIHKVLKRLMKDIKEFGPPMLYFNDPIEFQSIIKDAELENIQYTVRALDLSPQISKMKYMINKVVTYFTGYLKRLTRIKDTFYKLYTKYKEKSDYYNNKLTLFTTQDSYAAIVDPNRENVVTIRLLIEEVYNIIVKHPTGVKTSLGFITEIEEVFFSLWFNIELYYCDYKNIMDKAVDIVLNREAFRTVGAERARHERNIAFKLIRAAKEAARPYRGSFKFKELKFRSMENAEKSEEEQEQLDVPVKADFDFRPLSFDDIHTIHCPKQFRNQMKRERFDNAQDMIKKPPTPLETYDFDSLYNFACESDKESDVDYRGIQNLDIESVRPSTPSIHSSSISELKENTYMEQYIDKSVRDKFFLKTWDADLIDKADFVGAEDETEKKPEGEETAK